MLQEPQGRGNLILPILLVKTGMVVALGRILCAQMDNLLGHAPDLRVRRQVCSRTAVFTHLGQGLLQVSLLVLLMAHYWSPDPRHQDPLRQLGGASHQQRRTGRNGLRRRRQLLLQSLHFRLLNQRLEPLYHLNLSLSTLLLLQFRSTAIGQKHVVGDGSSPRGGFLAHHIPQSRRDGGVVVCRFYSKVYAHPGQVNVWDGD
mmetsp:Transcript_44942/g.97808  ORF Transcript_44942/g.97808 Transcript_44942/m.97808 type:complete len:202 (-) Transcript_44942:749-1354(-)